MAANLTAVFQLVDEMSDALSSIASSGDEAIEQWERAESAADSAFGTASSGVQRVADTCNGVASAVQEVGSAMEDGASSTDHWTSAVGDYDKEMLEAVYSTEELVEMGFKTADALQEEQAMLELCEQSAAALSDAINSSLPIHDELSAAMEASSEAASTLADNQNISAEALAQWESAAAAASNAMSELEAAQNEADAAMAAYDETIASGTSDLATLEAAAERAGHAAENLAQANANATAATEDLGKAVEQASQEAEKGGQASAQAIESIAGALAAAGITAALKEIAEGAYELAEAFSEAESTVVKATGATGDALDDLTASMMRTYAASKTGSLDETAAAVGEINTRMHLTGQELENTTNLFLDFSAATSGNAASAVRTVTQLMNQWNVSANELEGTMDKLTYAGQASGISVETLSSQLTANKAILDQLGFSLDESIAMFSQFELSGTQASQVMTGFRTALSSGAISSLNDLYDVFDRISTGEISAAEAADLFGRRAGPAIVNAVNQGVFALDDMVEALENTEGTTVKTAEAAQTLSQKWEQAGNNIKAAFTNALAPSINSFSEGLAGAVNSIGTFLNEHPVVTQALTAIGVGLGVVAAGVAVTAAAMTGAIPAVVGFGVALNEALGPIGWISLGITALGAALAAFGLIGGTAKSEAEGLTETSRQQYYAVQSLTAEYENACAAYGENSSEALRLKNQLDDLQAAYESTRQTVEEFASECDSLVSSHQELMQSYEDSMSAIDKQETGTLGLIQRLEDLASANTRTAASENQMKAIIQQLNNDIPGLALSYDDLASGASGWADSLKRAAQAQAEQQREAQAVQTYVDALSEQMALEEQIAATEENLALARERLASASIGPGSSATDREQYYSATEAVQVYEDKLAELNGALEENKGVIADIEDRWNAQAEAAQAALESATSGEEAALVTLQQFEGEIQALCAAYDEAYAAAKASFDGQFGLFDEAQASMDATVANAQKALDSQLSYWQNYSSNIETLKSMSADDLGITQQNYEALMSYVQDGSAEAAGLAQDMVNQINAGNTEAVAALGETVGQVQAARAEAAASVAEWQTDFQGKLNDLKSSMQEAVEGLDLSDEAKTKATATIESYISGLSGGTGDAVVQAEQLSSAVKNALEGNTEGIEATVTFTPDTEAVDGYTPPDVEGKATYIPETSAVDGYTPPNVEGSATYTPDTSAVDGYTAPDKTAKAAYTVDSSAPDAYQPDDKDAEAVYKVNSSSVDRWTPPNKTATVTYTIQTSGSIPGHASGTTDAEDVFVAGEQGPELIVGKAGATVFPAEETERILNAVSAISDRRSAPVVATATTPRAAAFSDYGDTYTMERTLNEGDVLTETIINNGDTIYNYEAARENDETGSIIYFPVDAGKDRDTFRETPADAGTKRIILSLEGKGNIEVSGNGADTEQIVAVLYEHLKPALTKIITEEIFEEGDGTYGY